MRTPKVRISNACTYSQHGQCTGYEDRYPYGRHFRCICGCHKSPRLKPAHRLRTKEGGG